MSPWWPAALPLLVVLSAAAVEISPDQRRSGFDFMGPDTQAMQRDDFSNPGMLWVQDGEALWNRKAGAAGRSCADCHGAAETAMRGIAARYPAFDPKQGGPIDLEQRIDLCRRTAQGADGLPFESPELLALTAYVARWSRGLPVAPDPDPRLEPFRARGAALFHERRGQLNLSCSQCHDEHWGGRLGSSPIPQAHPTGYPLYRLEWQSLGSLQRRLRNCESAVRAEPFAYGSAENVALELFLMDRARGMPMETPGVRP
jgi:L-cysteine S-thiosulfotransferase